VKTAQAVQKTVVSRARQMVFMVVGGEISIVQAFRNHLCTSYDAHAETIATLFLRPAHVDPMACCTFSRPAFIR
jgi:hypothetical protein